MTSQRSTAAEAAAETFSSDGVDVGVGVGVAAPSLRQSSAGFPLVFRERRERNDDDWEGRERGGGGAVRRSGGGKKRRCGGQTGNAMGVCRLHNTSSCLPKRAPEVRMGWCV